MKKNKGVSLIELIVSIVIFSIIIVGVVLFNSSNTKAIIKSERNAKRVLLQEKTIEEFKGWLKSASIPGSRFDSLWTYLEVGDTIASSPPEASGISVSLVIDSFIPDDAADVTDAGVRLQVNVISADPNLNINEATVTFISRHD